jgi:dTDP-4-dehydrorhamnose 3,5-epimerase
MKIHPTELKGVLVIEPEILSDARGHFLETYNARAFAEAGIVEQFVQDNQSRSKRGVLRGLHCQREKAQGKLIRVLAGDLMWPWIFGRIRAHSENGQGSTSRPGSER